MSSIQSSASQNYNTPSEGALIQQEDPDAGSQLTVIHSLLKSDYQSINQSINQFI